MKKNYWAKAPLPREQIVLFQTKLDEVISDDHPARLIAELAAGYDWSAWEEVYHGGRGQPPIHPRILTLLWVYGLRRGVRSGRKMEYMTQTNLDFLWLAEGHRPDHTTFCNFRTDFKDQVKDFYKYIVKVALAAGLARLAGVASDGTHIQANANRFECWTQEKIAAALPKLLAEFALQLEEHAASEALGDTRPEPEQGQFFEELGGDSENHLPPELADKQARLEKLREIQQQLQEADAARAKEGTDIQKNPAQIPMHDSDSRIMPNKEGGYAPNYTPIATTESHGGFIVDQDVVSEISDAATLLPSIDRIQADYGETPEQALADGAYGTGPNIREMERREIEFYTHLVMPDPATNPALRADPTQPVPESQRPELPLSPQTKKLDKACFVYDAEHDLYYCPQGERLEYTEKKSDVRRGQKREWRVYRCESCATCPLREKCVSSRSKSGRTVTRDVYTPDRERMALKMADPANQKIYDQRMRIAETPFALIKQVLGLRQFLLRGLDKIKIEWQWTCLSVNLDKLVRGLLRLRTEFAALIASEAL